MTATKEKRLLASPGEAHAFATKTRGTFRRPLKPQPPDPAQVRKLAGDDFHLFTDHRTPGRWRVAGPVWAVRYLMKGRGGGIGPQWTCPFAKGARWWVAETLGFLPATNETFYVASLDGSDCYEDGDGGTFGDDDLFKTPPQHLTRRDARSVVEVTSARCDLRRGVWEWVVSWRKVEG